MTRPLSQLVFLCRRHTSLAVDIGVNLGVLSIVAIAAAIVGIWWVPVVVILVLGFLYFYARLTAEHQISLIETMTSIAKRMHTRLGEAHRENEILRDKLDNQIKVSRIKSLIGTKHPRKN